MNYHIFQETDILHCSHLTIFEYQTIEHTLGVYDYGRSQWSNGGRGYFRLACAKN